MPRLTPAGRRRLAALAVGIALLYGAFEYGRSLAGYSALSSLIQRQAQSNRIDELEEETSRLRQRLAADAVGRKVDAEAQSESQAMIGDLQAELARQQQELDFYRGLLAEKFGTGTIKLQELAVRPEGGDRYTILVTLVQSTARDALATGSLTIKVTGSRGGALTQLRLSDIADGRRERVHFSLRYFTTVEVPVTLPAGFKPAAVDLEFQTDRGGPEPVQQSFPWSGVLGLERDTALTPGASPG
jgi:hypothetical protein